MPIRTERERQLRLSKITISTFLEGKINAQEESEEVFKFGGCVEESVHGD